MWRIVHYKELDSESYWSKTSPQPIDNTPSTSGSTGGIIYIQQLKSMFPKAPKRRASVKPLLSKGSPMKTAVLTTTTHISWFPWPAGYTRWKCAKLTSHRASDSTGGQDVRCNSTMHHKICKSITTWPPTSLHRTRCTPEIDNDSIPNLPLTDLRYQLSRHYFQ